MDLTTPRSRRVRTVVLGYYCHCVLFARIPPAVFKTYFNSRTGANSEQKVVHEICRDAAVPAVESSSCFGKTVSEHDNIA